MNRPHPALDKASTLLNSILEKSDTCILPPLRELARLSGVSPATILKEIKTLQKQNRLVTRWGHQIRVNGKVKSGEKNYHEIRQAKWIQTRDAIISDFLSGSYVPGTILPLKKELQCRYNVSYQTISKALNVLMSAGKIEIVAGGFRIPVSQRRARWRPKIVIISAGTEPGIPKIVTERERVFYQYLTIEAAQAKVELNFVIYQDWISEPVFYPLKSNSCPYLFDDDSVLGYIVSSWHIKNIQECLTRLSHIRKPVAVWIETSISTHSHFPGKQLALFNIGYSSSCGQQMGEHLLKLGHREIAFLSPFHKSKWSQERLFGLIDAFRRQGSAFKVHPFTSSLAKNEWDFTSEVIERSDLYAVLGVDAISKEIPICLKGRIDLFRNEGVKLLRDSLILKRIKEHLDHILNMSQITAIVGANDLCALLALQYLKGRGIGVPSVISLAGFDNSFDALVNGLTSYNFDTHSLVRAMITYAVGGLFTKNKTGVYLFEGTVIDRSTTQDIIQAELGD